LPENVAPTSPQFSSGWGGNAEYVLATDHAAMLADGVADAAHGWEEIFQIMKKVPDRAGKNCYWN